MKAAVVAVLVGLCALGACGGDATPPPAMAPAAAAEPPPPPEPPKPPPGALWRADVDRAVDAGVGVFMQNIDVEPSLDQGLFQGFRVVSLHPDAYWAGVDLRPGDVVLRVNGMPIETPFNAYDAMQSLKTADHVTVEYLRAGVRHELTYRILVAPGAAPSAPAASAASASAAPQPSAAPH